MNVKVIGLPKDVLLSRWYNASMLSDDKGPMSVEAAREILKEGGGLVNSFGKVQVNLDLTDKGIARSNGNVNIDCLSTCFPDGMSAGQKKIEDITEAVREEFGL